MKIKITRTSVAIVEVKLTDYPEGTTEVEALEIDRKNITEDPSIMDDWLTEDEVVVIRIE